MESAEHLTIIHLPERREPFLISANPSSLDCHISQFYSSLLVFDHLLHIPMGESYAHLPVSYLQCLMSICTFYQGFKSTSAQINWAILSLGLYAQTSCSSQDNKALECLFCGWTCTLLGFLKGIFCKCFHFTWLWRFSFYQFLHYSVMRSAESSKRQGKITFVNTSVYHVKIKESLLIVTSDKLYIKCFPQED